MTNLQGLLEQIDRTPRCEVSPSAGQPVLRSQERLPDDLAEFYRRCGGVRLFEGGDGAFEIVGPQALTRANPEIVGEECPEDISDTWYIVARGNGGALISIDCGPGRVGRCYDSFWDRHGVAGSCDIVALSFTELLRRLLDHHGDPSSWRAAGGPGYGDAYGRATDG